MIATQQDQNTPASQLANAPSDMAWLESTLLSAIQDQQAGRLSQAQQRYASVLQAYPDQAIAHHNLGIMLLEQHDMVNCLHHLRVALEAAPNEQQHWLSYVEALIQDQQYGYAGEVLAVGVEGGLAGEAVDALQSRLHQPLTISNDHQLKSNDASKASPSTPSQRLKNHKAATAPSVDEMNALIFQFNQGQYDIAEQSARLMVERYPRHGFGWKLLGALLQQQGKREEALQATLMAAERLPNDHEVQYNLGNSYYDSGEFNGALKAYEKATRLHPKFAKAYYNQACVLKDLQRFDDAIAAYRKALKWEPDHAQMNFDLGTLLNERGFYVASEPYLLRAIKLAPNYAEAYLNLSMVYQHLKQLDASEAYLRQAIQVAPNYASAHFNLANRLQAKGELAEAEAHYRQAVALEPSFGGAYNNLGTNLKEQGRLEEAIDCYDQVIRLSPGYGGAYNNKGIVLRDLGRYAEAETAYLQALQLNPHSPEALSNLGICFKEQGRFKEAECAYLQSLALRPNYPEANCNLGIVLEAQGRFSEAEACLNAAIEERAIFPEAYNNLGLVYKDQHRFEDAESCFKKAIAQRPGYSDALSNLGSTYKDEGRLELAEETFREALKGDPRYFKAFSNLLFCLTHMGKISAAELFAEHARFGEVFEAPLMAQWPTHSNVKDPSRALKVGFISADLRAHAVAFFIEPVLAKLSISPNISLYAYANSTTFDCVSARLQNYFHAWVPCIKLSDEALAEQIQQDGIDVLIDLSGHTAGHRLLSLAHKPAPVMASWIGYPGTTGLKAMDYYIADRFLLPTGKLDDQFTEKLVQLPASAPFKPVDNSPEVNTLPALQHGYLTFGSFNRASKLSQPVVQLWASILHSVPTSKMLLGAMPEDGSHDSVVEWFAQAGIGMERLILHPRSDMMTYLNLHHEVDICLDTFPYNGGTTTWHALWMGVPTITLAGDTLPCRIGAGILGHVGLDQFVVESEHGYCEQAMYWATHIHELADIRATLRDRFADSAPGKPEVIADGLEQAIRIMWQRWCADEAPSPIVMDAHVASVPSTKPKARQHQTAEAKPSIAEASASYSAITNVEQSAIETEQPVALAVTKADADRRRWQQQHQLYAQRCQDAQTVRASNFDAMAGPNKQEAFEHAIQEVIALAKQHEQNEAWQDAIQLYQEVLQLQPQHAEANHYMGRLLAMVASLEQALPFLERAVMQQPAIEQYWVTYIDALAQSGLVSAVEHALVLGQSHGLQTQTARMLADEFGLDYAAMMQAKQQADEAVKQAVLNALQVNTASEAPKLQVTKKQWPADTPVNPVFYIWALPYSEFSSGIKALHLLCDQLNRMGVEAYLANQEEAVATNPALQTPLLNNALREAHANSGRMQIGVYPEVKTRNPLGTPYVVRYLLNHPNYFNHTAWFGRYHEDDILWHYDASFLPAWVSSQEVRVQTVNRQLFCPPEDAKAVRRGFLVYPRNAKPDLNTIPDWCRPFEVLSLTNQRTPEAMAALYKTSQGMIVYERTAAALEAMLCGCPVIFCSSHGLKKETIVYQGFDDFGSVWDFDQAAFAKLQASLPTLPAIYDANTAADAQRLQQQVQRVLTAFSDHPIEMVKTTPACMLDKAQVQRLNGDWVGAVETYQQCMAYHPDDVETYYQCAELLESLGLNQATIEVLAAGEPYLQALPDDKGLNAIRFAYYAKLDGVMG